MWGKVLRPAGVPLSDSGDLVVILLLSEQSGLRTGTRLLWNVSLEVHLLMMTASRLEDTGKE